MKLNKYVRGLIEARVEQLKASLESKQRSLVKTKEVVRMHEDSISEEEAEVADLQVILKKG